MWRYPMVSVLGRQLWGAGIPILISPTSPHPPVTVSVPEDVGVPVWPLSSMPPCGGFLARICFLAGS